MAPCPTLTGIFLTTVFCGGDAGKHAKWFWGQDVGDWPLAASASKRRLREQGIQRVFISGELDFVEAQMWKHCKLKQALHPSKWGEHDLFQISTTFHLMFSQHLPPFLTQGINDQASHTKFPPGTSFQWDFLMLPFDAPNSLFHPGKGAARVYRVNYILS